MRFSRIWETLCEFFRGDRLEQARRKHEEAADRLDATVKELLKK